MKTKLSLAVILVASAHVGLSAASLPQRDPSTPPAGVSAPDWVGIRAAHEAARHAVRREADGRLVAENPGQQWRMRFDGRGFSVTPSSGQWTWGLELRRYGFQGAERTVEGAAVSHEQGRVHYDWDATLREWFINDKRGLEQGWTFHQRPAGGAAGGRLRVELAVRGGLAAQVAADGSSVSYRHASGETALTFSGLKAWDADGRALPVRFEEADVVGAGLRVAVDEAGARYPITIDPLAEQARILGPGAGDYFSGDQFGFSVALSGDTAVIGAWKDSSDAPASGAAYIYTRSGNTWTQQAFLKASNANEADLFGYSVSISGDTVVVGAQGEDGDGSSQANNSLNNAGAAYVFVRSGTTWTQQAYLKNTVPLSSSLFGQSVAVSGSTIVVGAPFFASGNGQAHVFVRDGEAWTQQAILMGDDGANPNNFFGESVAISGNSIVVGAGGHDVASPVTGDEIPNTGAAFVFVRSGTSWPQQAYLKPDILSPMDFLGSSVGISGDTVVAGAPGDDEGGQDSGTVYVYTRNGTSWSQQSRLKASVAQAGVRLGASVAISGDRVVAGAPVGSTEVLEGAAAYLFERSGSSWAQDDKFLPLVLDGAAGSNHVSVAISEETALMGIPYGVPRNMVVVHSGGAAGRVFNASNTGTPVGGVAGAEVTLFVGEEIFATATTDSGGRFVFPAPAPDLSQLHDVWLYKENIVDGVVVSTVQRAYGAARLSGPNAVQLVLPDQLQTALESELSRLEATGNFVLPYDTATARSLIADWNSAQPELASEHTARNAALGRLHSAAKGLADAYAPTEALAKDAGKLIANTIASISAAKEAAEALGQSAARQSAGLVAQGTTTNTVASVGMSFLVTALKDLADLAKDTFEEATEASLQLLIPEPYTGPTVALVDVAIDTAVAGFAESVSSGAWDRAALNDGGRKAMMEGLVEHLAEQVGGRVLASAYVLANQSTLDQAASRARSKDGSGTVVAGFQESQAKANEIFAKSAAATTASDTADSLTTQWGYVADLSQVVGRIPVAQIAAGIGAAIRALNVTIVVGVTVNDVVKLNQITFTDTPQVAEKAFFPSGSSGSAAPAPPLAGMFAKDSDEDGGPVASALPSGYATALAALRARVTTGDRAAAASDGQTLLAQEATLKTGLLVELNGMEARARAAVPARPALDAAVEQMRATDTELRLRINELNIALAGWFIPEFADPEMTQSGLLALMDAVTAGITAFDSARAAASAEAGGLTTPASLLVAEHGIVGASLAGEIPPGAAVLTARITNVGDATATGVTAQLVASNPEGTLTIVDVFAPITKSLGDIAPGASVTESWDLIVSDPSLEGVGSGTSYRIILDAASGQTSGASGSVQVISPPLTYSDWVSGFPALGALSGFNDDADGDGISNGLERYLGTNPLSPNTPPLNFVTTDGNMLLQHSRSFAPGADATARYEWSTNLINWHPSGTEADGLHVQIDPWIANGGGTGLKTIQLDPPQIHIGTTERLFFRLNVTENPPPVDPPTPVAPAITAPPTGGTIAAGADFTFSVAVTGTGPLIYQWRKNGALIIGATQSTYTKPDWQPADTGSYTVRIIAPGGMVTSGSVTLTVQ